jgi:hypothetical protein
MKPGAGPHGRSRGRRRTSDFVLQTVIGEYDTDKTMLKKIQFCMYILLCLQNCFRPPMPTSVQERFNLFISKIKNDLKTRGTHVAFSFLQKLTGGIE